MNDARRYADERWDIHTERMQSVAKAGIGAVTLLNSGSWIALLSQAEGLSKIDGARLALQQVLFCWGFGALLGTLCWVFFYWSAAAQYRHDMKRTSKFHVAELNFAFFVGLICVLVSLVLFARGVLSLGDLFT